MVKPTRQGWRVGVEEARKTICKPKGRALARNAAGGSAWWGVSTGQAAGKPALGRCRSPGVSGRAWWSTGSRLQFLGAYIPGIRSNERMSE